MMNQQGSFVAMAETKNAPPFPERRLEIFILRLSVNLHRKDRVFVAEEIVI